MFGEEELLYICSPLSAPTEELIKENMEKASGYAELVSRRFGGRAFAPHGILPKYLNDNIPAERKAAIDFGLSVVEICDAVIVCGNRVSKGMAGEIRRATKLGIPVYRLMMLDDIPMLVRFEGKEEELNACEICEDHLPER